jgi:hypothetical protein
MDWRRNSTRTKLNCFGANNSAARGGIIFETAPKLIFFGARRIAPPGWCLNISFYRLLAGELFCSVCKKKHSCERGEMSEILKIASKNRILIVGIAFAKDVVVAVFVVVFGWGTVTAPEVCGDLLPTAVAR